VQASIRERIFGNFPLTWDGTFIKESKKRRFKSSGGNKEVWTGKIERKKGHQSGRRGWGYSLAVDVLASCSNEAAREGSLIGRGGSSVIRGRAVEP